MDSPPIPNPNASETGRHGLPQAYPVRSQRERLREAMVRVAAAKGYEATTVIDVIEMAGVSRATTWKGTSATRASPPRVQRTH